MKNFIIKVLKNIIYVPVSVILGIFTWGFWWIFLKIKKIIKYLKPHLSRDTHLFLVISLAVIFISFFLLDFFLATLLNERLYNLFILDSKTHEKITHLLSYLEIFLFPIKPPIKPSTIIYFYLIPHLVIFIGLHFYCYSLAYVIEQHRQGKEVPDNVPYPINLVKIFFGISLLISIVVHFVITDYEVWFDVSYFMTFVSYGLFVLFWFRYINKNFNTYATFSHYF